MAKKRSQTARKIDERPTKDNRKIFRFHDGQSDRLADPLAAWLDLQDDSEFNIETHPAGMERGESDATRISIRATRRVFNVKPLADGGLTDAECLELLMQFFVYMGGLKKNGSGSPISSQPTESESLANCLTNSG